jgi:hypothetical protein
MKMDNKYNLSERDLAKAKKMAKKNGLYYRLLLKHPWLNGVTLIVFSLVGMLIWYLLRGTEDSLVMLMFEKILLFASIFAFFAGIYVIIKFLRNPEEMRKKQREYDQFLRK